MNGRAKQRVEQDVAAMHVIVIGSGGGSGQDQLAGKACLGGSRSGKAGMIGLACADRDDRVCAASDGFAKQEFEFSELVAAATQAVPIVTLDVDIHGAE